MLGGGVEGFPLGLDLNDFGGGAKMCHFFETKFHKKIVKFGMIVLK